jgi:predicted phosphodiesterase
MKREKIRVIIPDSHGDHIDWQAALAVIGDILLLGPDEIVFLGDHLDCGGTFNAHQMTYVSEMSESYEDDLEMANTFLDAIQRAGKGCDAYYLEGNHEQHVERWAARTMRNRRDADGLVKRYGPKAALRLDSRGVRYYQRSVMYQGLSIPGTIKLGKCFFTHGISHSSNAAADHLRRFGSNIVYGHCHRSESRVERTVSSDGFVAACPGTLAKLQPLYMHTRPTSWSHGYAVQHVLPSGEFMHLNVPIIKGRSLLSELARAVK